MNRVVINLSVLILSSFVSWRVSFIEITGTNDAELAVVVGTAKTRRTSPSAGARGGAGTKNRTGDLLPLRFRVSRPEVGHSYEHI